MCLTGVKFLRIVEEIKHFILLFIRIPYWNEKRKVLCVELAEQVRVLGFGLLCIVIDVVQLISSIVQDFGDGEWPVPWGCELVGFLLVQSKD